jgi:hypothetical protein
MSEEPYPWQDVDAARSNKRLQCKYSVVEGQAPYLAEARPCSQCGAAAEALAWFYYKSPDGLGTISAGERAG